MVKATESAVKTVNLNKRKWLIRLNQKVSEAGASFLSCMLVTHRPPGRQQAPNPADFNARNVETPYRSPLGDSGL